MRIPFINYAKELGFALSEIKELLSILEGRLKEFLKPFRGRTDECPGNVRATWIGTRGNRSLAVTP